jgi:hypothetical protein
MARRQRLESFAHRSRSAAALARRPDDGRVAVIVPIASYRPPLAVSKMSPKLREN